MNKHFEDARYYMKRAGEHAKKGITEELEPVETRFRDLTGREKEPEPSRLESIREDLKEIEQHAQGEAKEAIGNAREKIADYRGSDDEE